MHIFGGAVGHVENIFKNCVGDGTEGTLEKVMVMVMVMVLVMVMVMVMGMGMVMGK